VSAHFTITFVPRRDVDAIKAVRRLLKHAGRYLGLRAIDIREEHDAAAGDATTTSPGAEAQRPDDHFAPKGDDDVRLRQYEQGRPF
jgi:hypothetical protein